MHNCYSFSGTSKANGAVIPVTLKNRPRIPTPDVTKEVVDRENRLASMSVNGPSSLSVAGYPHHNDAPLLQLVLSPIKELGGEGGVAGTPAIVATTASGGGPGTAALAQAVLSPALSPVDMNGRKVFTTLTPVAVSSSILTPITAPALHLQSIPTLTEVTSGSEDDSGVASDRSRKTSVASQNKRSEVYV